jgi:hypothetical protein
VRRAPKIDRNQPEIVEALRKAGAFVQSLAGVADGCPDLLVGYGGATVVMEVKDGKAPPSARRLTEDQLKWHGQWRGGPLAVVCDVESALRVLGVISPPTKETT